MIRKIINIDEEKCNGCGICANACHEGAIDIIDGKAVKKAQMKKEHMPKELYKHSDCPGSRVMKIQREEVQGEKQQLTEKPFSRLSNWPVQIKLAPIQASYFEGAKLLIAADCTAYAYASMHDDFMKGKVTLIGCPKLDAVDYSEKLTQIIAKNDIQSVTIVRMEVPCCGGLEMAAKKALQASGKFIPWQVVTVGIDGTIKE